MALARRLRAEIFELPGLRVLEDELIREEPSRELDRLHILVDATGLGISGYQASDWLREHERTDMGLSDHARILATISIADDDTSAERLLRSLKRLTAAASELPNPPPVQIPDPPELELETVNRPRDAFFSQFEDVNAKDAAGRVAAEQITP